MTAPKISEFVNPCGESRIVYVPGKPCLQVKLFGREGTVNPGFPISTRVSDEATLVVMLSSTASEQILRTKRGKRNLIQRIRGNVHISLRDREFNPLVTKALANAFSQFMLDQILIDVVANAANEREIE